MTQDKTPTEALAQLRHLYANLTNGGVRDTASAKRIAEGLLSPAIAALEKWGSPVGYINRGIAPHTQGKVVFHEKPTKNLEKRWWMPDQAVYATPTPTQTQAGAVPLTCEWTHNDNDGFWETACGEAWRFDDGGPAENSMKFCHSCGNSLRIKGGQHGTDT